MSAQIVDPFKVPVTGSSFVVREVSLEGGHTVDDVLQAIRETPEHRWFVMVSEDPDRPAGLRDVLARIDDDLEFRVYAYGALEND